MDLQSYLKTNLNISGSGVEKIIEALKGYQREYGKITLENKERKKLKIRVPKYTLGEEIVNAITHGIGALFGIIGLVLMIVKAKSALAVATCSVFGATMILLYTMSCIYHSLSPKTEGKKVLRVLDHCNIHLLVFGTYIPVALLGVGGALGWSLFGLVGAASVTGIVFTAVNIDKYATVSVVCHLVSGWSILVGTSKLVASMGVGGLVFLIVGGALYSIGSILYFIGKKKKYIHGVFHVFTLAGTVFHFLSIYLFLL